MPHVTVEHGTGDNPVYQVGGKSFIFFRNPRPDAVDPETGERYPDVIVFWVESEADKQALVQDETSPFFTTAHFDGHPSVLLRASRIGELTRQELAEVSRTRGCPARQRAGRQPGSTHIRRCGHVPPEGGFVSSTALCHVLGIDVPIVLAPFGPWDEVELAAAVCNAGGLGSVGTAVRPVEELQRQWERLRGLTQRPFAINHTGRPFNQGAFEATLEAGSRLRSPSTWVCRPTWWARHTTADPLAADGGRRRVGPSSRSGRRGRAHRAGLRGGRERGWVSTMASSRTIVDIAGGIPVVAAGGIADGRGHRRRS